MDAYRRVRALAGHPPTRRSEDYIRQAAEWRQALMRRSEHDSSKATGRRAPQAELPPPLPYRPAAIALATATLWCALEIIAVLVASDGSSPLLQARVAIAVALIGTAAVVLAVGARHELRRLTPLVRAPGLVPAALAVAAGGFIAGVTALVIAVLTS
jgi:hypothetical protein